MRHSAHILLIYNENVSPRTGDDTFSPVREKVSKERAFVRAELPPEAGSKETVSGRQ